MEIPEAPATAAVEIRELYANFAIMAARIDGRTRYLRDFAAAMSHEFKTPLTGIRGALDLLADHDMTAEERSRFLGNAGADADRLQRLVQRLLDLARADMAVPQRVHCDPLAVMSRVADAIPALSVGTSGDSGEIPIDEDTLATVLTILMQNSVDAGARRATLDVSIAGEPTLLYADDGPGIPAADRGRVFAPFFTSRRARGGTGLGLPIARSLLSASEATIELVPSKQRAAFKLTFRAS